MKICFVKERKGYHFKNEFLDCTNYRDMYVPHRLYPDGPEQSPCRGGRHLIVSLIYENFNSVVFYRTDDLALGFIFDDKADEAAFLLWSSSGIDINY